MFYQQEGLYLIQLQFFCGEETFEVQKKEMEMVRRGAWPREYDKKYSERARKKEVPTAYPYLLKIQK